MELFLFTLGCLGWHLAVLALGAWLWSAKPWRKRIILVDREPFRPSPTAIQGRTVQPLYYDEEDNVFQAR